MADSTLPPSSGEYFLESGSRRAKVERDILAYFGGLSFKMNGKHDYQCGCVECIAYMETNLQNGKHDNQCGCVECVAYMETNLQVDLDEWVPDDVDFPGMVPSIRYSVGTATNGLTADTDGAVDTDRRLVDKNAVVLNPHSFGSVNPPDIRENVSETQRERIHETTRKERRVEQQKQRRALERQKNNETMLNERTELAAFNELRP